MRYCKILGSSTCYGSSQLSKCEAHNRRENTPQQMSPSCISAFSSWHFDNAIEKFCQKSAVKGRFIKQIFPFLFRTACRRLRDLCTQFSLMALINYPRLNWRILRVSQSEIFHHVILSMRRVLWENAWIEFISPPLFYAQPSYSSSELVAN